MTRAVYHEGERAVQERAGVRAMADRIGRGIDDALSPAIAEFLAQRYSVILGIIDLSGWPWASQVVGPPGFITALDERTLRFDAAPVAGDVLHESLRANPKLALLAIDLTTRRRARVNGRAELRASGAIELHVEEVFGNCPKYIQRREPVAVRTDDPVGAVEVEVEPAMSQKVRDLVAAADTFFLATAHPQGGADVSHRGGRTGFVRVIDRRTLLWPDYTGNMMFQSLGNLAVDGGAGLLFVDWGGSATVQLTGRASVDWDPERAAAFPGAQRLVELAVHEVRWNPAGNPIQWRLLESTPHNP